MKKDIDSSGDQSHSGTSLAAAVERIAQLLRKQTKTHEAKKRTSKILAPSPLTSTFHNTIGQIAQLLRSEIKKEKPQKSRYKYRPQK